MGEFQLIVFNRDFKLDKLDPGRKFLGDTLLFDI